MTAATGESAHVLAVLLWLAALFVLLFVFKLIVVVVKVVLLLLLLVLLFVFMPLSMLLLPLFVSRRQVTMSPWLKLGVRAPQLGGTANAPDE
jgi:hypothetical protein